MITAIKEAVTIPVMAKARIGHFVEAQVLEALGVDYIDIYRPSRLDFDVPIEETMGALAELVRERRAAVGVEIGDRDRRARRVQRADRGLAEAGGAAGDKGA